MYNLHLVMYTFLFYIVLECDGNEDVRRFFLGGREGATRNEIRYERRKPCRQFSSIISFHNIVTLNMVLPV